MKRFSKTGWWDRGSESVVLAMGRVRTEPGGWMLLPEPSLLSVASDPTRMAQTYQVDILSLVKSFGAQKTTKNRSGPKLLLIHTFCTKNQLRESSCALASCCGVALLKASACCGSPGLCAVTTRRTCAEPLARIISQLFLSLSFPSFPSRGDNTVTTKNIYILRNELRTIKTSKRL